MAKLDLDICLIDESVVMNGFRVLMSGALLASFKANPVLLFLHNRANEKFDSNTDNVILPIGKWDDIRIEGGKLLAKPEFDDDDEFAQKIQKKVEKGYLNAASIWLDPMECSDDPAYLLQGQCAPTVTKWGVLEASIVDIPNCRNALAIRNAAGQKVTLSAKNSSEVISFLETLNVNQQMDKKLLCAKLGLAEDATDVQISEKLTALKTNSDAHTQLSAENKTLKDKVVELTEAAQEKERTDLVDGAIRDQKLQAGDREHYLKLAKADFETTKAVIGAMKPYKSVESQLATGESEGDKAELAKLTAQSGKELYHNGGLERLKKLSLDVFKAKYKEAFGVEFKDK